VKKNLNFDDLLIKNLKIEGNGNVCHSLLSTKCLKEKLENLAPFNKNLTDKKIHVSKKAVKVD